MSLVSAGIRQRASGGLGPLCLAFAALLLLLAADALATPPPQVVASDRPLHSLLSGIMRGIAEPVLLIDRAAATADPVLSQTGLRHLAEADLIVWGGPELEPFLAEPLSVLDGRAEIVEVLASESLKVLPARHNERLRDPFFWLDSRNMLILLDAIAGRLIEMDPDRATLYRRNWQAMAVSLGDIDRTLEFGYRDVSGVPVFFYHDTHQYFQQAYAMHVAGSVAVVGDEGPDQAERLLQVRAQIGQADKTCVFSEKALEEPHLELLLAGTGISAVELDSFGVSLTPGPDLYLQLMRHNFALISGCVREARPRLADAEQDDYPVPDVRLFPERVKPRYAMLDQHGRTVTNDDFRGRFQLINFGYTYCPDICPTSLGIISMTMGLLRDEADEVQPIFITVDPERDTPQKLAEYVHYFHPDLLALSASPLATKRIAELFKARYEKVPTEDGDPRRYTMDHTASLYLLGRDGEFITKFAHGLPAREVAGRIRDFIAK